MLPGGRHVRRAPEGCLDENQVTYVLVGLSPAFTAAARHGMLDAGVGLLVARRNLANREMEVLVSSHLARLVVAFLPEVHMRFPHSVALTGLAVLVLAAPASPQQHAHPQGGERLGSVHFRTSCRPEVAPRFDRAVALLHSFEFGASIRAFEEVLAADSTCAMAYWGIALSRWTNPMAAGDRSTSLLRQGSQAAAAARRLGGRATARERGYIEAVSSLYDDFAHRGQRARVEAYERAMARLAADHPADTEAAIFHAIALTASAAPTDKTYAKQLQAGAILEALWREQPDHPGLAHYIIHTYDYPALASRASAAARKYAGIAPSAAHALHMPSHTFTRVGAWQGSVDANLRSMEAALGTGALGEALHATDYAVYALLQMGRDSAARALLDRLPPILARFDPDAITGAAPGSAGVFAGAAVPARWALERRAWREAAALQAKPSSYPYSEAMTYFARALGASRTGELLTARSSIDSLAVIQQRLAASGESYWAEQVAIQHLGAQAGLALAEHDTARALALMREAATREDATEKNAVTPGPLAPARELLGDLLMDLGRPADALVEYRATLTKEPNRFRALYGAMRAASAAGEGPEAARLAAELRTLTRDADRPGRAELGEIRR